MRRIDCALITASLIAATVEVTAQTDAGNTFFDAKVLPPGALSVDDELLFESELGAPDLLIGAFDAIGNEIDRDDDSSFLGDGSAPALFSVPIGSEGEINFTITGSSDGDFAGDHFEEGAYFAEISIFDSSQSFLDGFLIDDALSPEGTVDFFDSDPSWSDAFYDVVINNTLPNDVDYFRFTGLQPGATFTAETDTLQFNNIDTLLGWFDEQGELIESNDDIDPQNGLFLSRLSGQVPANGEVVLAVTGFLDDFFDGFHGQTGEYALIITLDGDYDLDGDVDTDDYDLWAQEYGTQAPFQSADGNGDGVVNAADYTVWRDAVGSLSAAAAPEPTGLSFVGLLSVLVGVGRMRSR